MRLRRAFALWLGLVIASCRTAPRTIQPETDGARFPNAAEIDLMMTGDSLPRPARFDRGPRYPVELRNAGVMGLLVAAFVVDTSGRVEPRSISFVKAATHPEFQWSVCRFLRDEARFIPRRGEGRPRRTLVFMPFAFTLNFADPPGPPANVRAYETRARELPRDQLVSELEGLPHC